MTHTVSDTVSAPREEKRARLLPSLLASTTLVSLGMGGMAAAQDSGGVIMLGPVQVEDDNPAQQNVTRFTAPLRDTPRTVTVIPREIIDERGATTLVEILRTTPGVTLGAGEGGTPVGDRIFIRGYEATTDIQIDGMRDIGRFSREAFNLESVEILKGPGSAFSGRGSTGGSLNLVSKTPRADNFIAGSATGGTDKLLRGTIDVNYKLSDEVAIRINAMGHTADTPGRDEVFSKRWGFAPSLAFGLTTATRLSVSYYHLSTEELPDFGIPFSNWREVTPPKTRRSNFFGLVNRDFRETTSDVGTLSIEHSFGQFVVRNVTRYVGTTNDYIVTRPSFANAANANAGIVNRDLRASARENDSWVNVTDLRGEFNTGSLRHSLLTGVEISDEKSTSLPAWSGGAASTTNLDNPTPHDAVAAITRTTNTSFAKWNNRSLFLFDTVVINDQWQVNGGIRYDDFKVKDATRSSQSNLWNYQAGLVYKPAPNGTLYFSFGTSSNPSGELAGQAGGADGAGAGTLTAANADLDPERSRTFELGTKWDLLDDKLALTFSVFHTKKTNARATDPVTNTVQLVGNNRTQGIEIGYSGNVTDKWKVYGGYTYLDTELTDDGAGANDGNKLKFIAPHSFNIWTSYDITGKFTVGGGANYVGKRFVNDANTLHFPSYWRLDAMAGYKITDRVGVQVNVQNLTNETYYDASHVGLFAYVAPGRSASVKLSFSY